MLPQAFISGFVKRAPKRKKIFVLGAIGQAVCLIGFGAALWSIFVVDQTASPVTYAWIIFTGSLFYLMTVASFGLVSEEESPEATQKLAGDLKKRLRLVWTDPVLRRFVIARTLLLGSALASPYLVILSQQKGFNLRSLAALSWLEDELLP